MPLSFRPATTPPVCRSLVPCVIEDHTAMHVSLISWGGGLGASACVFHEGGTMHSSAFREHLSASAPGDDPPQGPPTGAGGWETVPRELVHRLRADDVLLTGWERVDDDRFRVSVRWPDRHDHFTPRRRQYPPQLVGETMRQATMLLAHTEYGVPLEDQFLIRDLDYRLRPDRLGVGEGPARIDAEIVCSAVRRRRGRLVAMHCRMTACRGQEVVAVAAGNVSITTAAVYRRLRHTRPPAELAAFAVPVAPERVGRTDPRHVVLAPTPQAERWQLRADPLNATLTGRARDHYSGLILMEAVYQAVLAGPGRRDFCPASFSIDFLRYADFAPPCWIEAHTVPAATPGSTTVVVTGRQEGLTVFEASVGDARAF
ncbi:ScbA/BarX family gamma-butyrolactone biosynthesis protein [Streptomyces globisporus]|uniref:ScbA/BarX family gamma-butyrolactone biosynthesis protein n=1 Tax=Streptomyces globisporus TaxID=1908 RepID=UPI0037ABD31F